MSGYPSHFKIFAQRFQRFRSKKRQPPCLHVGARAERVLQDEHREPPAPRVSPPRSTPCCPSPANPCGTSESPVARTQLITRHYPNTNPTAFRSWAALISRLYARMAIRQVTAHVSLQSAMKITAKVLHLLWVVYFSFTLLGAISFGNDAEGDGMHSFRYFRADFPWFAGLALIWLLFSIGLFFGRFWIWFGCVIFTMLSLAFASWKALVSLGIPVPHDVFRDLFDFGTALIVHYTS